MINNELQQYLNKVKDFPLEIHLEQCSYCNGHCIMCPHKNQRAKKDPKNIIMKQAIFEKAIKEIGNKHLNYLHFHLNGEPLFARSDILKERIDYAREHCPNIEKLCIFTNGIRLDSSMREALLTSKLDVIMISVHAGNEEDYRKMVGLNWYHLYNNIKALVSEKKKLNSKLYIQTGFIPTKYNINSKEHYFKLFSELGVDHCGGGGVNNIGGHIDADNMLVKEQYIKGNINAPCMRLWLDLSIMSDGRACICSQDVLGEHIIGDLKTDTLQEIWKRLDLQRKLFIKGYKKLIKFCSKCDYMRGCVAPDWWRFD